MEKRIKMFFKKLSCSHYWVDENEHCELMTKRELIWAEINIPGLNPKLWICSKCNKRKVTDSITIPISYINYYENTRRD